MLDLSRARQLEFHWVEKMVMNLVGTLELP